MKIAQGNSSVKSSQVAVDCDGLACSGIENELFLPVNLTF
jgi:hypothetical protein